MIRVYWNRFPSVGEKKRKIEHETGRALLKFVLLREWGFDQMPDVFTDRYGKPYLKDEQQLFFNITHCHDIAACVVGDIPLGIDAEYVRTVSKALMARILSENEKRDFENLEEDIKRTRFIEYWTLKESYLKAKGIGIRISPAEVEFSFEKTGKPICVDPEFFCQQYWLEEKCVISVCGAGDSQSIELKQVDYKELSQATVPVQM